MLVHAAVASAQATTDATDSDNARVFTLGQVTITGEKPAEDSPADDTASAEEVWKFNANTLTDAVKLVPGVTSTFISNGRRNEGDISVRGFDRWRVPLSIDGIRVYLPADNRIDFNRFLTADLAEVQVRKGRVSVLDGPGAMGGAINLVTRKPVKAFESEFQGGASFDRSGSYEGWFGTALVGTKQDLWYAQGSFTQIDRDHWTLSKDFERQGPAEDGGERDFSATKDWRVNLKAGFTPNATDEYTLSYTTQNGEKLAPLGVDFLIDPASPATQPTVRNPPYQPNNYWTWPYWDVESGYWLSHTQFGDSTYLKTRLSYSEFDNALYAWDDINYATQSAAGRFRSYYHDSSFGGSAELGTSFFRDSTTRAAFHWRRDRHREYNDNRPTSTLRSVEPLQHNEEVTWSLALEQVWNAAQDLEFVAGLSYDKNQIRQAQEYGTPSATLLASGVTCVSPATAPCLYEYLDGGSDALNGQLGATWNYAGNASFGASISTRTRFPTNFERFSTRFGTAVPNPILGTERATNYELNWKGTPREGLQLTAAVFYADIRDLIQTVQYSPTTTQAQNVGDGNFYGLELGGDYRFSSQLRFGANYSYLHRKITDALLPTLKPTGSPDHLGFAYVEWQPVPAFIVQPSLEFAGNRWTDWNGNSTLAGYERIGNYTLANLQLTWKPRPNVEAVLGGRNLLDRNFSLARGFPEPGRSLFTKVRLSF
jgi:iron complex outermembrane receptor protein